MNRFLRKSAGLPPETTCWGDQQTINKTSFIDSVWRKAKYIYTGFSKNELTRILSFRISTTLHNHLKRGAVDDYRKIRFIEMAMTCCGDVI